MTPRVPWLALAREGLTYAWSARVASALISVLVAAACALTVLTVGRSAAAEGQITARLESAGARFLQLSDARDRGFLTPSLVRVVASFSTVEQAIGFQSAQDVTNAVLGPGGDPVPMWGVSGELSAMLTLVAGRMPGPGEALISHAAQTTLGMSAPAGAILTHEGVIVPVVGLYAPLPPFSDRDGVLLSVPSSSPLTTLSVVVTHSSEAQATQSAVLAILDRRDPSDLTVVSPLGIVQISDEILGDFAAFGTGLLVLSLGGGALLVAAVVLADTMLRRPDLGRRRALGASRLAVGSIVLVRVAASALAGAVVGCAVSISIASLAFGAVDLRFAAATGTLAVFAAIAASITPAVVAAWQDPVKVLRTA